VACDQLECLALLQNKPIVEARCLSWSPTAEHPAGAGLEPSDNVELLQNISFELARGERVLLTGPSGAGKSTLLHAIANVLQQTESGTFSGELYVRGRCGLVSQDPANSFVASALGAEVAFGPENLAEPESAIRAEVDTLLASVGIGYGVHRATAELSGGETQRLQIAAALAMKPELLLLDEPLSMLDQESAAGVLNVLKTELAAAPNTSALIVDHFAGRWQDVVTRVLTLGADGRIVHDESIAAHLFRVKNQPLPTPLSIEIEIPALANVALGSIKVIVGPSGSGKTTALRERLARLAPSQVGWVPQQAEQTIVGKTVLESATATVKNLDIEVATAVLLLQHLGLGMQLDQNPHQLSGGEMRRLALVSALAHHPRYLLLDEPTVGQDAQTAATVASVILAARQAGVQVIMATHDPRLIALADEVQPLELAEPTLAAPAASGRIAPLTALTLSIGLLFGSLAITSVSVAAICLSAVSLVGLLCFKLLPPFKPRRYVPVLIALVSIWLANGIFATGGINADSFGNASLVALKVAVFALPSVALAAALEPVALAAQMVKWLKVPARPAVVASAALLRAEQISWHWAAVRQTRALRGFGRGRGPIARTRELAATLAVLAASLRAAGDLAVSMQARGLGEESAKRRTWVRF